MRPARNRSESICLILNPRAGGGRAAGRIDELKRCAERSFAAWELRLTEGPGHAAVLAAEAARRGHELVAAVGGDGTCHEVVAGLVQAPELASEVIFTTIPLGTGSDLMRSLQVPARMDEALWVAATGRTRRVDVGRARWEDPSGPVEEPFINVAGLGANGEVVRAVNTMDKRLLGRASFLGASLSALSRYRPPLVELCWTGPDGVESRWEGPLMALFLANGAYCGGGMWVGRGGSMEDGALTVTLVQPGPALERVRDLRHLYGGTLDRVRGVIQVQATHVSVSSSDGTWLPLDLDGEARRGARAQFRVHARALAVRDGGGG
jgi:diacylglycerol kinase (ATP)